MELVNENYEQLFLGTLSVFRKTIYRNNFDHRTELFYGAILVIDSVDGSTVQTREMLMHMRELRMAQFVVFMSKQDTVEDEEMSWLTEMETRELLDE